MKKVRVTLTRVCTYHFEKELNEEEIAQLKQYEGMCGELGSDVIAIMGGDPSQDPDSWNDETEIEIQYKSEGEN